MLGLKTLKGVGWTVMARLVSRVIDFAVLLVLARLILPADFGLIAIALSIVTIIDMTLEVPLAQGLVTMRAPELSHYQTALTIGALRAALLVILFLALSALAAAAYKDPRLGPLVAILGLTPAARSLFSPRMSEHMRALDFQPMFVSQVGGKLIAAAATGIALWAGGGYWAIVTNNLVAASAATLLSYVFAPMPPAFTLKHWRVFAGLAGWYSGSQIVAALAWQMDRLLMGFSIRKDTLGQYTNASDLAMLPIQSLVAPAMQPVMSALAQVQDDPDRRARAFLFAANAAMLISIPACAFFLAAPEWIVRVLLGPRWPEAGPMLGALAVTLLPVAYSQSVSALAVSMNRMRSLFHVNALSLGALILFLPAGLALYAVDGVIAARVAAGGLTLIGLAVLVRQLAGIALITQLVHLVRPLAAGLIMTGGLWFMRLYFLRTDWPVLLELLIMGAAGSVIYVAALWCTGGLDSLRALLKARKPPI